jgi:phosphoglycerate kinase
MNPIKSKNIKPGDRVLIRSSLNVTLDDGENIIDDLRLRRMLGTIDLVIGAGGIPILLSHIKNDYGSTMMPVVQWFQNEGYDTVLVDDYNPHNNKILFEPSMLYIFENLRQHEGEKANEKDFARVLAEYGNLYINESFDSAHRNHTSIVSLPRLMPSYIGINFSNEVDQLSKVFIPNRPFTFIIGGAKIETKAPLIRKLLEKADKVFVGGALMNPLLAAQGVNVGKSLMPDDEIDLEDIANHSNLVLPVDFVKEGHQVVARLETDDQIMLLDIGPESTKALELLIEESDLVVWNGPLGNYEAGYALATNTIAKKLAGSDCYSIIGGGDTLAAFDDQLEKKIDWVSTGGGAMLDFIESNGNLPAISALRT